MFLIKNFRQTLKEYVLGNRFLHKNMEKLMLAKLRRDSSWLPESSIEMGSLLQNRLNALKDPIGGNRWLHHRWLSIFNTMFQDLENRVRLKPKFTYLLVGAGIRNPLAFPILMFMAGAEKIYVVEPKRIEQGENWRITWGMQNLLIRILTNNVKSEYFCREPAELSELVDMEALFFGEDLDKMLNKDRIVWMQSRLEDVQIPEQTIDLVSSRSVLEYVIDYEKCFDKLGKIVMQGGAMYHDFYLSNTIGSDPFEFYYSIPRVTDINFLRLSDYIRLFGKTGFESHVIRKTSVNGYKLDRKKMLERFRKKGDEDLLNQRVVLLSLKSGDAVS